MCGICGIYSNDGVGPEADVRVLAACQAMRYRGPDGQGLLHRDRARLGHVRLSIIDLSGGSQPLGNEDGSVHVVFNGEIYNFLELRETLLGKGHVFQTKSDTEVLVHLYEEYGSGMLEHLIGEFAFAIWDDRRQSLLLARDRLGVKPVFYAQVGQRLYFASDFCALLSLGDIPRRIDSSAVTTYLYTKTISAPRSIYKDVQVLRPGHFLEAVDGRVRTQEYWDVRYAADDSVSPESWSAQIESLLDDAVKRQLVSDVPLGAFLSGGVDSSTVVTSMVRSSMTPVKTFSIGFKEDAYDESRFYKLLAGQLGLEHHEFIFDPSAMDILPKLVRWFGQPAAIGSAVPLYYLSRMARQHVTVALSGDGGDEVFGGYNVYHFIRKLDRLAALGPLVKGRLVGWLLDRMKLSAASRMGNLLRRMRKIHRLVRLPRSLRMQLMADMGSYSGPLLRELSPEPLLGEYVEAFEKAQGCGDWLWPFLYADIKLLLPDHMFCKLDRMTMANSMEGRVPLVDYRLVELAAKIPSALKVRGSEVKYILKKAMGARLPQAVLTRKKVGFRVPFNEWFRGPLRSLACDLLTDRSFKENGVFASGLADTLLARHMAGTENLGGEILELVMFELWRRDIHEAHSFS